MCLILDTNVASEFFAQPVSAEFRPLIDWVSNPKTKGRIVTGGKNQAELSRMARGPVMAMLVELRRSGRVRTIECGASDGSDLETQEINTVCQSDDPHVILLARKSGARLLCAKDQALIKDFGNKQLIDNPRGIVFPLAAPQKSVTRILRNAHSNTCAI